MVGDNITSSDQERRELDETARRGETVVPGGTGGNSLEAQERLAEGYSSLFRTYFVGSLLIIKHC